MMELNNLKSMWQQMGDQLNDTQALSRQMVLETIRSRMLSTVETLRRDNYRNLLISTLITIGVFPFIYWQTAIQLSSFLLIEAVMTASIIWLGYNASLVAGLDFTQPVSRQSARILKFRKQMMYQRRLLTPTIVMVTLLFYYLEHASAWAYGLLAVCVILALLFSHNEKKRQDALLNSLEHDIRELES